MKYLLIALIALTSAKAFAHDTQIICIKKHDKHVNLCVQYGQHRHYRHDHYKPRMVTINSHRIHQLQPTNIPGYNTYRYEPSTVDRVLDTTIKIAIIKNLLED